MRKKVLIYIDKDEYVRNYFTYNSLDLKDYETVIFRHACKAIDEYGYVNISLPAVQKEKQKEKERQKKAKEEKLKRRQNETKT